MYSPCLAWLWRRSEAEKVLLALVTLLLSLFLSLFLSLSLSLTLSLSLSCRASYQFERIEGPLGGGLPFPFSFDNYGNNSALLFIRKKKASSISLSAET
jgi:hypothetical protein